MTPSVGREPLLRRPHQQVGAKGQDSSGQVWKVAHVVSVIELGGAECLSLIPKSGA